MWAYLDFVFIYFIFYFIRQVGLVFYARLRFCVGAAHSLIISTESFVCWFADHVMAVIKILNSFNQLPHGNDKVLCVPCGNDKSLRAGHVD